MESSTALILLFSTVVNNFAYSNIQLYVGKAFDVILKSGFQTAALMVPVFVILGSALSEGLTGVLRNFSGEFLAQRVERDSREELYLNLLGKSQTFHSRQRIGDIMARSTNDMRSLNLMFSPGVVLIMDSGLALVIPVLMIGMIHPALLLVPLIQMSL